MTCRKRLRFTAAVLSENLTPFPFHRRITPAPASSQYAVFNGIIACCRHVVKPCKNPLFIGIAQSGENADMVFPPLKYNSGCGVPLPYHSTSMTIGSLARSSTGIPLMWRNTCSARPVSPLKNSGRISALKGRGSWVFMRRTDFGRLG